MRLNEIEQKLRLQKQRTGLVSGRVTVQAYDNQEHPVTAHITPTSWDIEVTVRKDWNPIHDRRQKAYARKKSIKDGLETVVMHIGGLHEVAHWELPYNSGRGCPFDEYHHDKILEAVKAAISDDKQVHAGYVTNSFEDMIINPRCKEFNGDFSGQVLFWDWEGILTESQGFSPFYEAFVKLNMYLWGDSIDHALLKRHYKNSEKVDHAVSQVIKELQLTENIQDTRALFEKSQWPLMAQTFTNILASLLEELPTERLSAFTSNTSAGNGVEEKASTKSGKEAIASGRFESGDKLSPNITEFEQLDALYQRLARSIPIQVEAMTREQTLPIGTLTYRPFDGGVDDPLKIKLSKLILHDEGITFGVPRRPLVIKARHKIQRRSFPNFNLIQLDNSGSMRYNTKNEHDTSGNPVNVGSTSFIPWGSKSKYHFGLLGSYGIINFLVEQGIAQYIRHGVALFSSQTRYEEGSFSELDRVRRFQLHPEWGSTNIDATILKEILQEKESFVLSISDGEVANWGSERLAIKELLDRVYFAHLQLGNKTNMTDDLISWGKQVFFVRTGDDLSQMMVNATMKLYKELS